MLYAPHRVRWMMQELAGCRGIGARRSHPQGGSVDGGNIAANRREIKLKLQVVPG